MYPLRSRDMCPLLLAVALLLTPLQVDGTAAEADQRSTSSSSGRSIWESDVFFLQKLASFFGAGAAEKKEEPQRRIERRPPLRPEMIPPQLYYPDRRDSREGDYLAMVGHALTPPGGKRGAKKQPPLRTRPGIPVKQQQPFLIRGPPRTHGEKMNLRRVPVTRPIRQQQRRPDVIYPTNFRIPPPVNEAYRENNFKYQNINSILASPPAKSTRIPQLRQSTRGPPFKPTPSPQIPFHKTRRPFFPKQSIHPLANEVDPQGVYSSFSPPRPSSLVHQPDEHQQSLKDPLMLSGSTEKRITQLKLHRSPVDPLFNQINYLEPSKHLRKIPYHPRPAPRPQRVRVSPTHHSIPEKYSGSDDFQPSPKEGSMLENAFQPIFRASQSLDVELPASFMKPLHVASGRSLTITTTATPPPPQIIDFFEKDGVRQPDELAKAFEV